MIQALGHSVAGIEIVKAKQVGLYDVKVVRGDTTEAICAWLGENGYGYGENDEAVFEDYVDRGWCFVAAKLHADPNTPEQIIVAEGMAAPLILQFASKSPVYPLALTSVAGTKTEVLLYALADSKLTCGERLRLQRAREIDPEKALHVPLAMAEVEKWALFDDMPDKPMMLCKFKGRLPPEKMKRDLVLEPAADNEPYRETKVVW